jgi:hypothetical protein
MALHGRTRDGWATSGGVTIRVDRPRLVRVGAAANDNRAPAITVLRRLAFAALGAMAASALWLMLG